MKTENALGVEVQVVSIGDSDIGSWPVQVRVSLKPHLAGDAPPARSFRDEQGTVGVGTDGEYLYWPG